MAGSLLVLLIVAGGCSTQVDLASEKPPIVASAATCKNAAEKQVSGQPLEIVVVEKQGGVSAGERYLTRFADLNESCVPSGSTTGAYRGSHEPRTDSFTFAPNITAGHASKIADEIRSTGLFARVTEMTVPPCATPGISATCTPPTIP
jgi:hypothetical protein